MTADEIHKFEICVISLGIAFPLSVCCLIVLTQECIQRHLPLSSVRLHMKPRLTIVNMAGAAGRTSVGILNGERVTARHYGGW